VRAVAIPAPVSLGPSWSKRLLAFASDETLVEQIRRRNEAAFSIAFERHAAGLLGFCRHMVGSPEEAEDAVQHTFAAAFRDLTRPGERKVALKPWLYAIARNRCLSVLRSRRERAALDFDLPTEGLAEQVERRADLRDLLRDLRDLPEDQRAALLLSEAGDLSHAEVAGVLGCEVANVKALVFRARSGLIKRREAREVPCADIREQLANLRGSSLRRSGLRHHLRSCAGCRDYREQVGHQRRMLAAALPVVPSLDLRSSVLAASGLGGGSAGGGLAAGVGTGLSASLGAGTLVKIAAVGVLAGGAVASGNAFLGEDDRPSAPPLQTAPLAPGSSRADFGAQAGEGRPIKPGAQPSESPAVDRATDPGAPEQRSGAAPPGPARPDGQRDPGQDQNANRAPLAEEAGGHESPAAGAGAESQSRGPTAAPRAVTPVNGGPRAGTPVNGGPPAHAPIKGGPPAHAPIKGGPPADAPVKRGPPAGTPVEPGPPPGAPAERAPPAGAPGPRGRTEPKPDPQPRPNPAPSEPIPVVAPEPPRAQPPSSGPP
jgi:RNA polymerase sigma factor (sigma-70 family)